MAVSILCMISSMVSVIDNPNLPILFNVNIGHATPRCIIPFGVDATIDADKQVIRFANFY